MKMHSSHGLSLLTGILFLGAALAGGQTPPDLTSGFDVDTGSWRASDAGAVLSWQSTGGATGGYLRGQGPGTE